MILILFMLLLVISSLLIVLAVDTLAFGTECSSDTVLATCITIESETSSDN